MPTIYLDPTSDGTVTGWATSGGTLASCTDDYDNGGLDNGAHDSDITWARPPTKTSSQAFMLIQDTPSDFDPANVTGLRIKWAARKVIGGVSGGEDQQDGHVQVFKSDETTALTDEATRTNIDSSFSGNEWTETMTQQGSPSKADWDGARVRIRNTYTAIDAADTNSFLSFTAIRVEIDYTDAPPPSDAPETLRVVTSNLRIR